MQKSLSKYEMTGAYESNGDAVCDHERAIKNYSRSAADQEEPLAHELRDAKVLQVRDTNPSMRLWRLPLV